MFVLCHYVVKVGAKQAKVRRPPYLISLGLISLKPQLPPMIGLAVEAFPIFQSGSMISPFMVYMISVLRDASILRQPYHTCC